MTKKKDPSLSKREAFMLAWKNRADYKGYDKTKGSSFNSWRSIINTQKGRMIGFPESWKNYNTFMKEVQGEWEHGKIVCRLDITRPYSKSNAIWSVKGSENTSKLTKLTYNGETKTLLEWAKETNQNYNGMRQRYFKGKNYKGHKMAKITQQELLKRYGISLPKGKYDIEIIGDKYKIYTIKDDTDGCLLIGLNKTKGAVLCSKNAMAFFMDRTPNEFELKIG